MSDAPNFLTQPAMPALPPPGEHRIAKNEYRVPEQEPPFLQAPSSQLKARRPRWLLRLSLALFVVLAIVCAPLAYGLAEAAIGARTLQTSLKHAVEHATTQEFTDALSDVAAAQAGLSQVQAGLRITGTWRFLPVIGARLQALEGVARSGDAALGALQSLLTAAASIHDALAAAGLVTDSSLGVAPSRSFNDLSVDERRDILARIANTLPEVREARDKMAIALDAWQRIPDNDLVAPAKQALAPFATALPEAKRQLDEVVSLADVALPLLGYPKAKTYLVLLQNADELRPTGGFIGTVGEWRVNAGTVERFGFDDVYNVDSPSIGKLTDAPPEILQRELGIQAWYLRDSNWSPDFPTAAERIRDVYARERAFAGATTTVDGVIALEPQLFRDLLTLLGPITVEGKRFDAQNFFDELEYDVEMGFRADGTPQRQRKEVVQKLGQVLLGDLMALSSSDWPKLLDLVSNALAKKDILVYDPDPAVRPLLDARGWTGRMGSSEDRDFLAVVDANLAALKTDGMMDKDVSYKVDMTDPTGPVATVTLRYHNRTQKVDWRYTRYRSYTRVYVPEGSEFLSSDGAMLDDKLHTGGVVRPGTVDVGHELGKTFFGAFWAIEPGETRELTFRYRLPSSIFQLPTSPLAGAYHLRVQKQPGTNTRLTLDHAFGKNIQSATPPEAETDFGDQRYHVVQALDRDTDFVVKFKN